MRTVATPAPVAAPDPHELEHQRVREELDKATDRHIALLKGFGTLTTSVNAAVNRLDRAGLTRTQAWVLTLSAAAIAVAEVGAKLGWW